MTPLPRAFLASPLAHRGLHDGNKAVPENSRAAVSAAVAAGYGIEIDVQVSVDGHAIVFHDFTLGRMTTAQGSVKDRDRAALASVPLTPNGEGIPSLTEVLDIVGGRVPLLIEIKDKDPGKSTTPRPLEASVSAAIKGYAGPVAVMSFNPDAIRHFGALSPDTPLGLTTDAVAPADYPKLGSDDLTYLREIAAFDEIGASFISHDAKDLGAAPVSALKTRGIPILCWTIRSKAEEAKARQIADGITFEGYKAAFP